MNEAFVYMYGAIPAVVFGHVQLPPELMSLPAYGTLISSMFLHGGWMHLIGNMLYLWIFGNNIEDVMGHGKFIVFYGVCGVLAALSHAFLDPESTIPMVGASGAISGVLGAYLLLYPRARVLVFIPIGFFSQMIYVPAARCPRLVVPPAIAQWRDEFWPRRRGSSFLCAHRRIPCRNGFDWIV